MVKQARARDQQSGRKQWSDITGEKVRGEKYLKTIYECLERCTSLLSGEPPGGKQPDVLKLDEALRIDGNL